MCDVIQAECCLEGEGHQPHQTQLVYAQSKSHIDEQPYLRSRYWREEEVSECTIDHAPAEAQDSAVEETALAGTSDKGDRQDDTQDKEEQSVKAFTRKLVLAFRCSHECCRANKPLVSAAEMAAEEWNYYAWILVRSHTWRMKSGVQITQDFTTTEGGSKSTA